MSALQCAATYERPMSGDLVCCVREAGHIGMHETPDRDTQWRDSQPLRLGELVKGMEDRNADLMERLAKSEAEVLHLKERLRLTQCANQSAAMRELEQFRVERDELIKQATAFVNRWQ